MESKTIRFEKGNYYTSKYLWVLFNTIPSTHFEGTESGRLCLKSFTVQINIIEDEEAQQLILTRTKMVARDGGTRVYLDDSGKQYFMDKRLPHTETTGKIFDRYPSEEGAKIITLPYKLIEDEES